MVRSSFYPTEEHGLYNRFKTFSDYWNEDYDLIQDDD